MPQDERRKRFLALSEGGLARLPVSVDPLDEVPFALADLALSGRFTCQAAPVLAEGTIADKQFLFRSRHTGWRFAVADGPEPNPALVFDPSQGFVVRGEIRGEGEHPASHMATEEALELITKCARKYLDETRYRGQ